MAAKNEQEVPFGYDSFGYHREIYLAGHRASEAGKDLGLKVVIPTDWSTPTLLLRYRWEGIYIPEDREYDKHHYDQHHFLLIGTVDQYRDNPNPAAQRLARWAEEQLRKRPPRVFPKIGSVQTLEISDDFHRWNGILPDPKLNTWYDGRRLLYRPGVLPGLRDSLVEYGQEHSLADTQREILERVVDLVREEIAELEAGRGSLQGQAFRRWRS